MTLGTTYQSGTRLGVSESVVDAPWLNCDNAHLAALQQFYGVKEASVAMGSQWAFQWEPARPVPATLRVPVLDAIAKATGLVFKRQQIPMSSYFDSIAEFISCGTPVMVYGDSVHMPWLPYYQHDSAPHPFIIEGVDPGVEYLLVEAYTNSTPWGPVVPGKAAVSNPEFETLIRALDPSQRGEVVALDAQVPPDRESAAETVQMNAEGIIEHVTEHDEMREFAAHGRANAADPEAMARFDLGCWEVTRARSCHAVWLRRLSESAPEIVTPTLAEQFESEIAEPWRRVSQFAFVGSQRVQKGKEAPSSSFDLIEHALVQAEAAFALELLRHN